MVSYGEFHQMPAQMQKAKKLGLRRYLGVPRNIRVYLDNGAFYFLRTGQHGERRAYQDFVSQAQPDWYPIAFDVIPTPKMSTAKQRQCFDLTMAANRASDHDGFVPVIHVCQLLDEYVRTVRRSPKLVARSRIALGGMVPNLLRGPKALPYKIVLQNLSSVRAAFRDKKVHVFGIGGTATIHLAALLEIDSADSSGWRNRAARGIVQLPGSGDRMVSNLGKWRGRCPSENEWQQLGCCRCPACSLEGIKGLKVGGLRGFCNRATHNLWILLEEARWLEKQLKAKTYTNNYKRRLNNSTYFPLIRSTVTMRFPE
jgi:hypothetical protein